MSKQSRATNKNEEILTLREALEMQRYITLTLAAYCKEQAKEIKKLTQERDTK